MSLQKIKGISTFAKVLAILALATPTVMYSYGIFFGLPEHRIVDIIRNSPTDVVLRPFLNENLTKVCFVGDGADLRNYGITEDYDYYDKLAIIEYYDDYTDIGFVKNYFLTHRYPLIDGWSYCNNNPKNIILVYRNDIWEIEGGEL